jgi:microsomal dipeptidase-like Zn-dependent dipeptidase
VVLLALAALVLAGPSAAGAAPFPSVGALAHRCVTLQGQGPFLVQPAGLRSALLLDARGRLRGVAGGRVLFMGGPAQAGRRTIWRLRRAGRDTFAFTDQGVTRRWPVAAARGCARFPEAGLQARGRPLRGSLRGWADTHVHVTANLRAGGRVISGEPFDRAGVARALGGDGFVHGPDGSDDVTGNLLRSGTPFGDHDIHGWPTFAGWPTFDTNTHQQAYWRWLQRAWLGGMRLLVAQTVEDDELCRVEPRRAHSCSEAATIAKEVHVLRGLQDYVDAQAGGRGRGFFRLVRGPRAAARVIRSGKLAVVIGVESSNPFDCSLRPRVARCTRADVDRGLARYRRLGVRTMFVAHWFDNAFGGAALEGDGKGKLITGLDRLETGRWFETARCPHPGQGEEVDPPTTVEASVLARFFPAARPLVDNPAPAYPAGRQCNARGLTPLGAYLVRRMIATHTLIEVDHLSERARDRVLAIARRHHYPLVSSHNGTGGTWTPGELHRLRALGGIAAATPDRARGLIAKVARLRRVGFPAVPMGTDTGGFASLPGPERLRYPYRLAGVRFGRERSGRRTFALGRDGVAHYGLMPDLLADVRAHRGGHRTLRSLFGSAGAYVRMWRRSGAPG